MAQPTRYDREFNFANQQALTPTAPLPASHVEAELNRVKRTTDEIIDNLAKVQRDDGEVQNKTIGVDQLKDDLASLIGQGGPIEVPVFDSASALASAKIKSTIQAVQTGGYAAAGDGGGAHYKRVALEPAHLLKIQSADGAWWELVGPVVRPAMLGIQNGVDETTKLQSMLMFAADRAITVEWPDGGDFHFQRLNISGSNKKVTWRTPVGTCSLKSLATIPLGPSWDDDYAVRLSGQFVASDTLTTGLAKGRDFILVADTTPYKVGQILEIRSTRLIETDHRGQAREGQVALLDRIVGGTNIRLRDTTQVQYKAGDTVTGAIQAVGSTTQMTLPAAVNRQKRDMMLRMTMTSGAANGQIRWITDWDNTTKVATFGGRQDPWPAGILAGDTFLIEWTTVITRAEPIKIDISGDLRLYREPHNGAAAEDIGFRGVEVVWAHEPRIRGMSIHDFSETGIRMRACYGGSFEDGTVTGAVRAYNINDGTGYGVNIYQCWKTKVVNCKTSRCRRGFDISGTQQQSWFCEIVDCSATGGGFSYTDEAFWPWGAMQNSGFGSHGAGYNSRYKGCEAIDLYNGFSCRSRDEEIVDCLHKGYGYNCVRVYYGGGLRVSGFSYVDGFSEIGADASTRYVTPADASWRCEMFMEFQTSTYIKTLPTVVTNVALSKVSRAVFVFQDGSTNIASNLSFGNIRAFVSPEGVVGPLTDFTFIRMFGAPKNMRGLHDMGGNSYSFDGVEFTNFSMVDIASSNTQQESGQYWDIGPTRRVLATVNDDAVVKIPVAGRNGMLQLSIFDRRVDRTWRGVGLLLGASRTVDYSPLQASNKAGPIALSDQVLTGTTGTDGNLTLSYVGGYLYVENRTGAAISPVIEMAHLP